MNDSLQAIKKLVLEKRSEMLFVRTRGRSVYLKDTKYAVDFRKSNNKPFATALKKSTGEKSTIYKGDNLVTAFKSSGHAGEFNLHQYANGDWYGVYSNEQVMIATNEVRDGKTYVVPKKWLTSKHGYTEAGRVRNIRYIDQKSNIRRGDLKVYITLVDGLKVAFAR